MSMLIYLMGPSGSGKDSLLQALRARQESTVLVAHRYITRPADAGCENHVALNLQEFALRQRYGLFAMDWQANGQHYALGIEIDSWLTQGMKVVVNGSRAYLDTARRRYGAALFPVCLTVSQETLRSRLLLRGREDSAQIDARLLRAMDYHPQRCAYLSNDGALEHSVDRLIQLIDHASAVDYPERSIPQSSRGRYD